MSYGHEGSHLGRAIAWRVELADRLTEHRNRAADRLIARLDNRAPEATPLLARTLITIVAKAVETADPDSVIQWARAVKVTYRDQAVLELIDAVCDLVIETARGLPHADHGSLLVFIEVVRGRSHETLLDGKLPSRVEQTQHSVVDAMLALLRVRDEATCTHSQATGLWCRLLADAMGLGSAVVERIVVAGTLHDIGKIATPDHVLLKPGPLDADEWAIMQHHAILGFDILSEIPSLAQYAAIVRAHHERFDGTGYPDALRSTEIPFESRVVSVADAFHAMISERPYRRPLSFGEAMSTLAQGRGTQWDPEIVDVMVRVAAAQRARAADIGLEAALPENLSTNRPPAFLRTRAN